MLKRISGHLWKTVLLCGSAWLLSGAIHAAPLTASVAIPSSLEPWRAWVLDQHRDLECPPQYANLGERFCRWPGQLVLQVDAQAAQFSQSWQLYNEEWIALPGDDEYWPQEVRVDERAAVVVERDGKPAVRLPAGEHSVQGVIRWSQMPTRLSLPADTGLLSLSVQGKPVTQPALDAEGNLLLAENSAPATVADSLSVQVFRQVQDGIPLQMETVLRLHVAGRDREVVLGQFLLDGFVPLSLTTSLPARIEPDGRLRVQLRTGEWELVLRARASGQPMSFASKKLDEAWPNEEIWSWRDNRSLRQVTVKGPSAMDPSQTDMPAAWRQSPAWLMHSGDTLALTETQRGDTAQAGDTAGESLALRRDLWLDFDGGGMISRDVVSGVLPRAQRFSAPAAQQLGRVAVDGEPQLITHLEGQNTAGVELRAGALNLLSISRLTERDTVPASSWQRDMSSVEATLHVPPGWMLLHAEGVDRAVGSWLSQWNLWNIFLVLIVAAVSRRLLGWTAGIVALLALTLTHEAANAPLFLWLVALIGVGIQRVLPVGGFRRLLSVANGLVLAALVLMLLDFAVDQARSGMYPQLELGRYATIQQGGEPAQRSGVVGAVMQVADEAIGGSEALVEQAVPASAPVAKEMRALSSVMPHQKAAQRELKTGYDANAQVQTGPGEPAWRWRAISLHWSGPVLQDQTMHLYWLSPSLHRVWRLVSVLLAFAFAALLLRAAWPTVRLPLVRSGAAVAPALFVLALVGWPVQSVLAQPVGAAAFPSKDLLAELESRLTRLPDCEPQCASLNRGQLQVSGDSLRISLQWDAQEAVAVPLPSARNQWQPRTVLVDGSAVNNLRRDEQGVLWLVLSAGSHVVVLEGAVVGDSVQLPFAMTTHNIAVSAEGWQVSGVQDGRIPSGSVQLTRDRPAQAATMSEGETAALLPDAAPVFLRVTRTINLDLDWQVQTTVERLAPEQGAINIAVPLLSGEAVLTSGVVVQDGRVQVALAADAQTFTWSSRLQQVLQLQLTAAQNTPWVEQWQWRVSPIWHVVFSGLNPIKQGSPSSALPTWQPWPGEQLTATISRPPAVAGNTRTVESVELDYRPGARSADTVLRAQMRSSQGGEMPLTLPPDAVLQRVVIDGREQSNAAPVNGQIKLPLHPGQQQWEVSWRREQTMDWRIHTPQPQLAEPLNNIHITLHQPEGRWLLAVGGPAMGPALLYWGVLAVMVLVAVLLGQSRLAPLATWQWLLLGVGMSTVNSAGSLLVVLWFVAMAQRAKLDTRAMRCGNLQLLQVVLVILSVLALGSLVGTIPASLLSTPDMQVVGNQSTVQDLLWYQDRSVQGLPSAWVISLPMWVYRAAMLLWSLWLVFSLMTWCRWGWQCFSAGELWRSSLPNKKKSAANTASETQQTP